MILGRIVVTVELRFSVIKSNRKPPFQLRKFILRYIYTNLFPRET